MENLGFLSLHFYPEAKMRAVKRKISASGEAKQKEILDSIYYARRIQRALITNETYIKKNLIRLRAK